MAAAEHEAARSSISYQEAVQLLLSNRFGEAEAALRAHQPTPRHALMFAQVAFARACLSLSKADATEALSRAWGAEKLAADALSADGGAGAGGGLLASAVSSLSSLSLFGSAAPEPASPDGGAVRRLDAELVQADALVMGSLMQLVLGSYVKGAWNLSSAWKAYKRMHTLLETRPAAVTDEQRCLVLFGVGFFNLVVSLLPATYLSVAEVAGFSGDGRLARELLEESLKLEQYWSPFACLLLLYHDTQLSPLLGLPVQDNLLQAEALAARGLAAHPDAALFIWMQASLHRCRREHGLAVAAHEDAHARSAELPPLQLMIRYDQAWSHTLAAQWREASTAFAALAAHKLAKSSTPLFQYQHAILAACSGEADAARAALTALLEAPGAKAAQDDVKSVAAYVHFRARALLDGATAISAEAARTLVLEMVALWDMVQLLPSAVADGLLEVAAPVDPDSATPSALLARGILLEAAGSHDEARATFLRLATLAGGLGDAPTQFYAPFAWYHAGCVSLRKGDRASAAKELQRATDYQANPYMLQDMLYFKLACVTKLVGPGPA